jgi:hypothetical protein
MMSFRRQSFVGFFGCLLLAACSAGGDGPSTGTLPGSDGGSSTGGSLVVGGNGGSAARAGSTGQGGSAGTLIVAGNGTGAAGSGGTPMECQTFTATSRPVVPTVAIVVDNSSSMYEPRAELWDLLYDALMNPATGAVKPLEGKVRFGFSTFRGVDGTSVPEDDESCAEVVSVPYGLDNFAAIDEAYAAVGADARGDLGCAKLGPNMCQTKDWETPTGHAINRVVTELLAYQPDPPGRKYILLVTDGTPNTCLVGDPNCGQDVALKALQDAYAAEIQTFVIGMGAVLSESSAGCETRWGRCAADYLQDAANAGSGAPVEPPPMEYWYQQCATMQTGANPGTPVATYAAVGGGGTEPYYTARSSSELLTALTGLLSDVASCTFDMNAYVTGDPTNSLVQLNGSPLAYGDTAAGWILEPNKYQVTLQGSACETFKSASQGGAEVNVNIVFYCDPETGEPIAEPR